MANRYAGLAHFIVVYCFYFEGVGFDSPTKEIKRWSVVLAVLSSW